MKGLPALLCLYVGLASCAKEVRTFNHIQRKTRQPDILTVAPAEKKAPSAIVNMVALPETNGTIGTNSNTNTSFLNTGEPTSHVGLSDLQNSDNGAYSPATMVYYITAVFNRDILFQQCIKSLEKHKTVDPNFKWIVVDYGPEEDGTKKKLEESGIQHTYISKIDDRFSRTMGMQDALNLVPGEGSLVFALDLVIVPEDLGQRIRRNVIRNKQIYAPVMFSLNPGEPETSRSGKFYWESWGLIGFVKGDTKDFGGFTGVNWDKINIFQYGCEDIFMADAFGNKGMKASRGEVAGLVHYSLSQQDRDRLNDKLVKTHSEWKQYDEGRNDYDSADDYCRQTYNVLMGQEVLKPK